MRVLIEQRIENRTCTRGEWHAYRRYRSWSDHYGVDLPGYYLALPVVAADARRAARKMARAFERSGIRAAIERSSTIRAKVCR